MGRWVKAWEIFGRKLLFAALGLLCGVSRRLLPAVFGHEPESHGLQQSDRPQHFLVVRLDERLGNVILLTPLLLSLKNLYPEAIIDVVVARRAVPVLTGHEALGEVLPFAKKQLVGPMGFLGLLLRLRAQRYDLAIDGANPTSPSLTHALMVRFCGARHTLGFGSGLPGRLYSHAVPEPTPSHDPAQEAHEIDLRLRLLAPLGLRRPIRTMAVSKHMPLPPQSALPSFLRSLDGALFVLINVGARTAPKQLRAADYAVVANSITVAGMVPVLSFGPQETELAKEVANFSAQAVLAPPTSVQELAHLMRRALCVISCDTGPMHLAVALGRPTCGLFVSTNPARYGHRHGSHAVIDARGRDHGQWLPELRAFLWRQRLCEVSRPKAPELLPEEMTPLLVDGNPLRRAGGTR